MRKLAYMVFAILILSVGTVQAESVQFRKLSQPVFCSFFGRPLQVVNVETTGKEFFNNSTQKYTYGYKVTVRRPSKDDGRGVAYDGLNYRLYYWAAEDQYSPSIAVKNGMEVYQDINKSNNRFVTLYITTGLQPGVHRIRIALFPYLMYSSTGSFRDAITIYRHDYVSILKRFFKSTTPTGFAAGVVWDKGESVAVDTGLLWISTKFGQVIEFEVPAIMPRIQTRYATDAATQLKRNGLIPRPDFKHTIPTHDKRFDRRVAKVQYEFNQKLHAGTPVAYKFYKYVGGTPANPTTFDKKEKCGDGIDNNGNHQIDEGCYDKEILVDDNKCRDDTIGVYIDGKNFGNTPAGHKREYDMSRVKRGWHYLEIVALNSAGKSMKCDDNDVVTWGVTLGKGMKFYSGGRQKSGELHANAHERKKKVAKFSIFVP